MSQTNLSSSLVSFLKNLASILGLDLIGFCLKNTPKKRVKIIKKRRRNKEKKIEEKNEGKKPKRKYFVAFPTQQLTTKSLEWRLRGDIART